MPGRHIYHLLKYAPHACLCSFFSVVACIFFLLNRKHAIYAAAAGVALTAVSVKEDATVIAAKDAVSKE